MDSAKSRGLELATVDIRKSVFQPGADFGCDVALLRCLSSTIIHQAAGFFDSVEVPVVNSPAVIRICDNKFFTSLVLVKHNVPTVSFAVAFSAEEAAAAVEAVGGFPVILKSVTGSWGRLLAKINDRDALEGVIEQKMVLGSPLQKILYFQKFIEKKGRDIRVTMAGDKFMTAISREAEHWITNTARGAKAYPLKIDRQLNDICLQASRAVGGGILGIDVFGNDDGYQVNEINHTPEFKNVVRVTGSDVPGAILDYCQERLS